MALGSSYRSSSQVWVLVCVLGVACGDPTPEQVEEACSPEFIAQYDEAVIDTKYQNLVTVAETYGINNAADEEEQVCTDYKNNYTEKRSSYEDLASNVKDAADAESEAAGGRSDIMRWVTFEVVNEDVSVPDGWITFSCVIFSKEQPSEPTFVAENCDYEIKMIDGENTWKIKAYTNGLGETRIQRFTFGYPLAPPDNTNIENLQAM